MPDFFFPIDLIGQGSRGPLAETDRWDNSHAARREGRLVARSLTRYRLGSAVLQQLRRRRLNSRGRA